MRTRRVIATAVVLAWVAAMGLQESDSESVLQRTRQRLLDDLARLPRYTCVQTITRRYFEAPSDRRRSCSALIADHDRRAQALTLRAWDRLRLEVAIVEGNNVYSWVGASRFEGDNIEKLAGHGPLGSGDFGSFLDSVFRYASIHFQGENVVQGRRLLEYVYEVPVERSGYLVRDGSSWEPTAYSGSFLLDPGSTDIVQMTVRTNELPPTNPSCQANSEIQYQRTRIHDRLVLIPEETRLNAIDRDGAESASVTAYANCREYASKSRVLATAPEESTAGSAAQPESAVPIAAGLSFAARIVTPVDSETAAAGDPVEGLLRSSIHDKKSGVSISAGARLHGRLTLMEHRLETGYRSGGVGAIRLAVQWETMTAAGREIPLRTQPEESSRTDWISVIPAAHTPGERTFLFRKDHLHLEQFDWNWSTVDAGSRSDDPKSLAAAPAANRPRTEEIAEGEFTIDGGSALEFKISVPPGAALARLEGAFSVSGRNENDLAVSVLSSQEFLHWQKEEPATALYESGQTHQGSVNVPLPPGSGAYYLIFNNHFPLSTPKIVKVSLRLHYTI